MLKWFNKAYRKEKRENERLQEKRQKAVKELEKIVSVMKNSY